jgi:hypothetical protein
VNLTYTTGIPATNNDPSVDQPNMQTNTDSINAWVQIDHHGFGDTIGGYHSIIHQDTTTPLARTINRTTGAAPIGFPAAIAGINQIFAALVTTPSGTDTQLFSLTGNNGLSQLTGNFATTEGYFWVSGILVQWGTVTGLAYTTPAAITFSARANCINFPNSCFTVVCTLIDGTTTTDNTIYIRVKSNTQFTWGKTSSSGSYTGFNWIAIGD